MENAYREFSAIMKRRAFKEAVEFASRRSLEKGGSDGFWLTQYSLALREAGRIDEAVGAADKACAVAPRNAWALIARAEALLKKGDVDGAVDSFNEAMSDARAGTRARKGILVCLARKDHWERILSFLAQNDLPPNDSFSWRVKALMGLGRNDEAEKACDEQLASDPDHPAALWKKCELRVAAEGVEPVRQRFSRLARIPGKPPVYAEIYAWLCKRSGNLSGAVEQYERLSRSGGNPSVLRKQAFALAKSGHEGRAVGLMEELLRLAPDDRYLHAAYLPACTRLGDLERAWKFYHELQALHPEQKGLYGRLKRVQKAIEKKNKEQTP
ncbi:MAG: tetratricopeptide repeat protein [Chitinispirillaceae bacterium]|nr:tetratricopeptide repeat protein [Chitinispirillaceae bacterium]